MTYFNKFPLLNASLDNGKSITIVTDILKRIAVSESTKENFTIYDEYDVQEGETPELVSYKFYKDSQYHWVILLINDILDPKFDWPLTEEQVYTYAGNKYGTANVNLTHHYIQSEGSDLVVDPQQYNLYWYMFEIPIGQYIYYVRFPGIYYPFAQAVEIKNVVHEAALNDKKRRIKILRPQYLPGFLSEFETLLNA